MVSAAQISNDTFRRVRAGAGITFDLKGHAAGNRPYPPEQVDRLIDAVHRGRFGKRKEITNAWRGWDTDSAAS